jgi:hypothetical protein
MADEQLGGAAREALHVVMLGHPVAAVAGALDGLRDAGRAADGLRGRLTELDADEVEDSEGHLCGCTGSGHT